MLRKYGPLVLLGTLCLIMLATGCAKRVPIQDFDRSPIPQVSAKMTDEKIRNAIVRGGSSIGWRVIPEDGRSLVATLDKGKTMLAMDITFTQKEYSLKYRNSINLKAEDGKIHSSYLRWVRNLQRAIDMELARIQ